MSDMQREARIFARYLTEPLREHVIKALDLLPQHLVPRIIIDSQSPWISVDTIPGPKLAIWINTGDIYEVGDNGAVGEEPVSRNRR